MLIVLEFSKRAASTVMIGLAAFEVAADDARARDRDLFETLWILWLLLRLRRATARQQGGDGRREQRAIDDLRLFACAF